MKVIRKAPRGALFTIVALALGLVIAACGSASSSSSTTGSASAAASGSSTTTSASSGASGLSARRTQLVACLKQHGVTLPSRPAGAPPAGGTGTGTTGTGGPPSGGGFFGGGGGAGRFANNPKMQAAFKACGANFGFRRGNFAGRISHTTITKYVACVNQHGYKLPAPNFSGKGPIFPSNIRTNPKFVAASKACQSILVPPRPSGGTSTNSGA
ncbi:MAG TPA: hypothetical protein VME22_26690 [Solirubrobacteraceae bacterium]|nr:hypothetical protein [Solirubrobacteraceae bacterium]